MKLKAQKGFVLFNGVIYSLDKSIKQITVTNKSNSNKTNQ